MLVGIRTRKSRMPKFWHTYVILHDNFIVIVKPWLCKNHYEFCIKYEISESLDNGILSNGKEIMEYLLKLKSKNTGKHVNNLYECSVQHVLQWMFCNVYPTHYCCCYKIYNKNG